MTSPDERRPTHGAHDPDSPDLAAHDSPAHDPDSPDPDRAPDPTHRAPEPVTVRTGDRADDRAELRADHRRGSASTRLRRRARAAVARSAAGDRSLATLIGLALLAVGVLVALLSSGVFGAGRAARPLLDPMVADALRAQPPIARSVAVLAGLLLTVLGLVWAARSLRPEPRPDLHLDAGPDTRIVVSSTAAAEALGRQVGALPGVGRARARLVGPEGEPALRLTLWLTEDADLGAVLDDLDGRVLAEARDALGQDVLPVAVRLELDVVAPPPRVA